MRVRGHALSGAGELGTETADDKTRPKKMAVNPTSTLSHCASAVVGVVRCTSLRTGRRPGRGEGHRARPKSRMLCDTARGGSQLLGDLPGGGLEASLTAKGGAFLGLDPRVLRRS